MAQKARFGLTLSNRGVVLGLTTPGELLSLAQKAESAEIFHHLWVGDQIMAKPRLESITLMAAVAARTTRIKIGVACMASLPSRNPVVLAYQWASLDQLSNGRMIMVACMGVSETQNLARVEQVNMGITNRERAPRMEENIHIMRRLWAEDRVTFQGEFHRLEGAFVEPKPVQQPRPEVWVGRAGRPGVRRVAQWGLEGFCGAPTAETYQLYLDKCREFGTEPKAQAQTLLFGHVHEDHEKAWAEAEPYATHVHQYYQKWRGAAGDTGRFQGSPKDDFVIGDPDHWVRRIQQAVEAQSGGIRPNHLLVQLQLAGMPHEMAMRSIELFANRVLPHIHEW